MSLRPVLAVVRARRREQAAVVGLSLVASVSEAVALVLVVQIAAAVSSGAGAIDLDSGVLSFVPRADVDVLVVLALVACLTRLAGHIGAAAVAASIGARSTERLRKELLAAFVRTSWSEQTKHRPGEVTHLVLGQVQRAATVEVTVTGAIISSITLLALGAAAFLVNPLVAALIFAVVVLLAVLLRPLARKTRNTSTELNEAHRGLSATVTDAAGTLAELRLFGVGDRFLRSLDAEVTRIQGLWRRNQILTRITAPMYQSLGLALVVVGLIAARSLETTQLASLGAVVVLLVRALSVSGRLQAAYQQLHNLAPSVETVQSAIRRFESARDDGGAVDVDSVETVEFDRVGFGYSAGEPVLHQVSFTLTRGEVVGLVGRSGAGKSTLVQLLLGLRRPWTGDITVDGRPLADLSLAAYQSRFAVVPQEPRLVRGSVAENIRFLREATDAEVEAVARTAGVHEEILSLPDGYETQVGPGAADLSGGQRQRVVLARALLGKPDVLVLDEPTSALDAVAEERVREAVDALRGDTAVVVIAHRATTLAVCDRLLDVTGGTVTETPVPMPAAG